VIHLALQIAPGAKQLIRDELQIVWLKVVTFLDLERGRHSVRNDYLLAAQSKSERLSAGRASKKVENVDSQRFLLMLCDTSFAS
jgi:hypothetical protein